MNRTYPSSALRYRTIDTGKVVIGRAYIPPAPSPDADAERIQKTLLTKPRKIDADKVALTSSVVSLVAVAVMAVAGWLPGGAV
jgi:hypothetical protein